MLLQQQEGYIKMPCLVLNGIGELQTKLEGPKELFNSN